MALPRMRHRTGAAGVAAAKARNLDAAVVAAVQLVEKGSHQAGAVAPDEMAPGVQACGGVQDFWIVGDRHVGKEGRACSPFDECSPCVCRLTTEKSWKPFFVDDAVLLQHCFST